MIFSEFYSEVGKLLYAVADVDGKISQKERDAIHQLVQEELVPIEQSKDDFGTDSAYYTEFEFDVLEEQQIPAQLALQSFLDFIVEHKTAITPELKSASIKVAEKMAAVYYGTNRQEEALLEKIKNELIAL